MLGLLRATNARLPTHLREFFTYIDQTLALVSWLALECAYTARAFNDMAAAYIVSSLLPYIWCVILAAMWALVWFWPSRRAKRKAEGQPTIDVWFTSKMVLSASAVWFVLYTAVAYVILTMFSCVRLDDLAKAGTLPQRQPLVAPGWFWVADTQLQCWSGDHAALAYGAGVIGVIITLVAVPARLLWGLYKRRDMLAARESLDSYGLLYYHYSGARYAWEGAVWLRKLVLACAMVFLYTYGPLAQLLLFLGIVLLALLAHLVAKPVPNPLLNRLELMVLGAVTVTLVLLLGLAAGGVAPYSIGGYVLSVVIIVLDSVVLLLLVGLLLWELALSMAATPLPELVAQQEEAQKRKVQVEQGAGGEQARRVASAPPALRS
jgi:hypothetical protein